MATEPTPDLEEPTLTPLEDVPRAAGEMTLIEHLRELRNRVMVCAIVTFVAILVAFWFRDLIFDILLKPGREAAGEDFQLAAFAPTESLVVTFKLCLFAGLIMASPVVIYEILAFVVPGLTPRERRLLLPGMAGVTLFLLAGMAFSYFMIIPASLGFLLNFQDDNIETFIRAEYYIDFVTRIVFFVGLSFELPMVACAPGEAWRRARRAADPFLALCHCPHRYHCRRGDTDARHADNEPGGGTASVALRARDPVRMDPAARSAARSRTSMTPGLPEPVGPLVEMVA